MSHINFRDEKELSNIYLNTNISVKQIAKENNVSKKTIFVWLNKFGIPKRTELGRIDKDWLYSQYITKRRMITDIAKELNCSYGKVRQSLIRYKIPIRTTGESLKGRNLPKNHPWHKGLKGSKHPSWKHNWNDLCYSQRHRRIEKIKPKPKKCAICNKDKKRLELSNKDYRYSKDPETWEYLCLSCHRKKDYKYNIYNIAREFLKEELGVSLSQIHEEKFLKFISEKIKQNKQNKQNHLSNTFSKEVSEIYGGLKR